MKLTFYGVRGSYPTARRDQLRYGGNSTCLLLEAGDAKLILDGGTGIRVLGRQLMGQEFQFGHGEAYILVGHTHWDHIMGYPFFRPFYIEGNHFTFASAGQTGVHLREILSGQHRDLHFPVPFQALAADMDFVTFKPGESFSLGPFEIATVQLNHPGITVGYRIEADGASVVVFTDTARITKVRVGDGMGGPDPDPAFARTYTARLAELCHHADVLVHDTHFLEHELTSRYHWGHSSIEDALDIAHRGSVRTLVLFHHSPTHSDAIVDRKLAMALDLNRGSPMRIEAAAEGMRILVGEGRRASVERRSPSGTWEVR